MILDEICAHKRVEVEERKSAVPLADLEERIEAIRPADDFREALRRQPGVSLIAEVKRASPSKGPLLEDADPVDLAALYEQNGARSISVLTDGKYFKGCLDDLSSVRQNVRIPCLRKDFTIDEYQIYEARASRADAILLIMRILSDEQVKDYLALTRELGMCALVETHDAEEIDRALAQGAHIIGINNRDLADFTVDIATTLELKKRVPGGHVLVSESGIHTRDHVKTLEDGGVDAILVGEALLTSNDVAAKMHQLLGTDEAD